jgi:hypothetical protein
MTTSKAITEVSATKDDIQMPPPTSMIRRQMEQFMDMQMQVSQATSQLITSIHQVRTRPISASGSHSNDIDDQEILSVLLTLIAHLERLAEVHNQILPRWSQLMNPRQRMLETHEEPVQKQIAEEQRDVYLNHPSANQEDCYCRKHFGLPYFQGDSSNKGRRSKHLSSRFDQNIKVHPRQKESLMLNPPSVNELQRIHASLEQEYSEYA